MNSKIKNYSRIFFPKSTTLLVFASLVILLTIYFFVSQYSSSFITNEGYAIFDGGDQNILVRVIFYLPWASWIDRSLDFIFWGVLAAIVLIIAWSISAAKTSFANHHLVEGFENFQESKQQWHRHFIVALFVKMLLIITSAYLAGATLFKLIPSLSTSVNDALTTTNLAQVSQVTLAALYLFFALFGIAICVKTFRHVKAD